MDEASACRVGVDIGGTFTDIVLVKGDGTIATKKLLSTTQDYSKGIIDGLGALLREEGLRPGSLGAVAHGTTVATNAILEEKGARTALVTTEGFRDVLELRRVRIPQLYNLFYQKPRPLVPRRLRLEVRERVGARGEVRVPLDMASVEEAIERLKGLDVQAVAVCLLHSYANPTHERLVGQMVGQALPDTFVSCSTEILPEIREYERTSTTVINAYIGPVVKRYLTSLLDSLRSIGVQAPLRVMQSNGGVMTAQMAMMKPANIVESGPAAGVIASAELARLAGYRNVITLDMGGTTAKASMIENGELARTPEYEVGGGINLSGQLVQGGGYALKLPFIDISEIGAGGGSIVWIDKGGMLQVGPQSAGAFPGPACYSQGGTEATVTDALVTLGYINPAYLAGGEVPLDAERAQRAIAGRVAGPMGMSLSEAAYGVYQMASARMIRAVKAVSTYRGRDPRDFILLGFGGNGPVFAAGMAKLLGMRRALIPPAPGLFSAFGLLFANVEYPLVQTHLREVSSLDEGDLNEVYARLEDQALATLGEDGYAPDRVVMRRMADLRYAGQAYELTVPMPAARLGAGEISAMAEAFEAEHLRTYGHRSVGDAIELVNLRVAAQARRERRSVYDPAAAVAAGRVAGRQPHRRAYFGAEHGAMETPVLARGDLAGAMVQGPAIIEEYDATCVVPPKCEVHLDDWGNIVLDMGVSVGQGI